MRTSVREEAPDQLILIKVNLSHDRIKVHLHLNGIPPIPSQLLLVALVLALALLLLWTCIVHKQTNQNHHSID